MIDTVGQPEFMEVMPCLIHNSDLTILVLDLTKSLDAYPTLTLHDDGTVEIRQVLREVVFLGPGQRGGCCREEGHLCVRASPSTEAVPEDTGTVM